MNNYRDSIYRTALQVSPERIARLNDVELNQLMGRLLLAQSYKCNCPISDVRFNTEVKASDDGCDGWTSIPIMSDQWLGTSNTCWQFKAGHAGERSRLADEVIKRFPRETLLAGGRFVVITSGSTNGKKGEEERLNALINEADAAGIPSTNLDVIGSERLAIWCNQHPAIAAYLSGRPEGLWTLDKWLNSDEHQVPWRSSESIQSEINTLRADIDFISGRSYHVHIKGQPGVGKTRFALEVCRDAPWRNTVVYIRDAGDVRLRELIDSAVDDNGVQLMVIADEVQLEQLRPLRESVGMGYGRVRLITIGHCGTSDSLRIPTYSIKPLNRQEMFEVVKGWYPAMPLEHVNFVVGFADGFVRLAKLAADAIARSPRMNVPELLSRDEIRGFLDRMLGTSDRRPLYVVAVLASVGWTHDKEDEGKAIARHFGLDWNNVRYAIEEFHTHFGIVPRGGRYRYISPTPLGIRLAVEAWNNYPEQLSSLLDILPSDEARNAYLERMQSIASNTRVGDFARMELNQIVLLDDFIDGRTVRRWSTLAAADPDTAARNLFHALRGATVEDRNRIGFEARRYVVGTLVRLAWRSTSFHHATKALALLAEAENEKWANNATGGFVNLFKITLGGTSKPYVSRLLVLDEIIEENNPVLTKIVIKALSQAGNRDNWRIESGSITDEVPEQEWYPSSSKEYIDCVKEAITRLILIANQSVPGFQDDLVASAENLSTYLREGVIRNSVVDLFLTINKAYPQSRERLRRIVADEQKREDVIRQDDELREKIGYWKLLTKNDLADIKKLHTELEDSSLDAQLLQYVGVPSWNSDEQLDLTLIANELLADLALFAKHWPWLTSGEAESAWRLGHSLAKVDTGGKLAHIMALFPSRGRDLRLLCGYIQIKREEYGDDWYDRWINSIMIQDPEPETVVFEVVWRCGATEFLAEKLVEILRNKDINPQLVGSLAYGRWSENLPNSILENLLMAMYDTGHHETAIGILFSLMRSHPDELSQWDSLALKLVTAPKLIRSNQMTSFHWREIANIITSIHPGEIAAAIIKEHVENKRGGWFLEFSDAAPILGTCTRFAPLYVWRIIRPFLSSIDAYEFCSGFPEGIVDFLPFEVIKDWVDEHPGERASIIFQLVSKNVSHDETLASQLISEYGTDDLISRAFLSSYLSGGWSGPSSIHWDQFANELEEVARRTNLIKLRNWAENSTQNLRQMAERERQKESEEIIRGF